MKPVLLTEPRSNTTVLARVRAQHRAALTSLAICTHAYRQYLDTEEARRRWRRSTPPRAL
jgi:hypothetical protein